MRTRSSLAAAIAVAATLGIGQPSAEALGLRKLARVADWGIRRGDRLLRGLTANDAGGHLTLLDGKRIGLGSLVGKGWFGAVYRLDERTAAELVPAHDGPVVAKLPHGWRWSAVRALRNRWRGDREAVGPASLPAKSRLRAEVFMRRLLDDAIPSVEASPRFPPDPSWTPGTLPVVPILSSLMTTRGPIVLKPLVRGLNPGEIFRRHGGLTPAMEASLGELYGLAQAFADRVRVAPTLGLSVPRVAPTGSGAPMSLDIRPANLMWVEDPHVMRSLSLKRPSFVFVELDLAGLNSPQYLAARTSLADYLQEVKTTAREAAGR